MFFSALVMVVFENHGFDQVTGLPSHQRLLKTGAVHTAWYDTTHPSGPNYRSLLAGDFVTTDEILNQPIPTIASGFSGAYVVNWRGAPAARHDPLSDCHAPHETWTANQFDLMLAGPVKPMSPEWQRGLWYVGLDDSNNAHSAPLEIADANLSTLLNQLDASPWFNSSDENGKYPALFCVWDEVYNSDERVFAAWYGKGVKPRSYSTFRNHYSFCRTCSNNFGLSPLAHAAGVTPVDEIWV